MCTSNIRHEDDNHTVIEQLMHNASTAIDETEVILAVRDLPDRVHAKLDDALEHLAESRQRLLEALEELPRVTGGRS